MEITFWGVRGAVPICGREFERYGGETTCLEVKDPGSGHRVILDTGTGAKKLGDSLLEEQVSRVDLLYTHTHWDHIMGIPMFRPLYQPGFGINLYGRPQFQGNLYKLVFRNLLRAPHFPVSVKALPCCISYLEVPARFQLGNFDIETIPLSHPNLGQGFKIRLHGATFVFLTDNELRYRHRGGKDFQDYARFAWGADLLVHDSEYTRQRYAETRGWGHSTWQDALELASEAGVKRLGLFHHNQSRTDEQLDKLGWEVREQVDKQGLALECFALSQGQVLRLG